MVDEVDRDEQLHTRSAAQAHQINMGRQIFYHIALHATANDAHIFLTFNLEVEQSREEAAFFQALEQLVKGDLDRKRVSPTAIHNTGHFAFTASLTSGPLACPRPCLGDKIRNLTSHSYISICYGPPPRVSGP